MKAGDTKTSSERAFETLDVRANVISLRPLISDLGPPTPSLNILPGSTPNVWQPHTPSANAITQSSW